MPYKVLTIHTFVRESSIDMIVDISVSRCCSTISQLEAKVNEDCTAF
ncbi:11316_t:CDS:2 [Rhizophagus irregularis]|nr:11316_t:CDS:2 [Rhizophagus irregularis]